MDYTNNTKKEQFHKGKVFNSRKKLEVALTIRHLRGFSADEIAEAFGTSRQNINIRYKKFKEQFKEAAK